MTNVTKMLIAVFVLGTGMSSCAWSNTLAACGSDIGSGAPEPAESSGDIVLRFEDEVYPPGDHAMFTWELSDGDGPNAGTTGDEWRVQCWNGTSWNDAWMAMAVYDDQPFARSLDDEFAVTSDGWSLLDGTVVIPGEAPEGWYRVTPFVGDGRDVEARFIVEP